MSNRKMPAPSTKNGRRSEKNVSNADRLTTAGSASTWPKSGLTVAGEREARLERVLEIDADVAPDRFASLQRVAVLRPAASSRRRRRTAPARGASATGRAAGRSARRTTTRSRSRSSPAAARSSSRSAGRSARTMASPNVVDSAALESAAGRTESRNSARQPRSLRLTGDVPHRVPALIVVGVVEPVACPA